MQLIEGIDAQTWSALHFSDDPIISPRTVGIYEQSRYGVANSIDVQWIPKASASVDLVICCHVIEHVPDHRKAVTELNRILSSRGFMLLAYPSPSSLLKSIDWGYPRSEEFGHYREIGRDFELEFSSLVPGTVSSRSKAETP